MRHHLIDEPPMQLMSCTLPQRCCNALQGWPEGLIPWGFWLDAGGPLDAAPRIPCGGVWTYELPGHGNVLVFGSAEREA